MCYSRKYHSANEMNLKQSIKEKRCKFHVREYSKILNRINRIDITGNVVLQSIHLSQSHGNYNVLLPILGDMLMEL